MARFRKKRRFPGPSKNEKKTRREAEKQRTAPRLAQRYPDLAGLEVEVAFLGAQGQQLGEFRRKLGPEDPCDLDAECPGMCGGVRLPLGPMIDKMLTEGKPALEFEEACAGFQVGTELPCGGKAKGVIRLGLRPANVG